MTPAARARSDAYFEGGYWLTLWDFLLGILLAWALLGWRFSARMRDLAARLTRFRWAQTALYAIQYFLLTTVVSLPWVAYEAYVRERQYGMSNQGLAGWLGDQAKELVIALIFGTLAAVAIYAVIRKLPAFQRVALKFGERWGFREVGDVAGLPLLIALLSVYMFVLTPMFNTITRSMEAEADAFGPRGDKSRILMALLEPQRPTPANRVIAALPRH
jgi:CAAX prenyl protease N-terminal, five membrane helices